MEKLSKFVNAHDKVIGIAITVMFFVSLIYAFQNLNATFVFILMMGITLRLFLKAEAENFKKLQLILCGFLCLSFIPSEVLHIISTKDISFTIGWTIPIIFTFLSINIHYIKINDADKLKWEALTDILLTLFFLWNAYEGFV